MALGLRPVRTFSWTLLLPLLVFMRGDPVGNACPFNTNGKCKNSPNSYTRIVRAVVSGKQNRRTVAGAAFGRPELFALFITVRGRMAPARHALRFRAGRGRTAIDTLYIPDDDCPCNCP